MQAGARLAVWHLNEALRFSATVAEPAEVGNARNLEAWLVARCRETGTDRVSTRDLSREGPNATRKSEWRDRALSLLAEAGRIRIETDGRQKLVRANPALLAP